MKKKFLAIIICFCIILQAISGLACNGPTKKDPIVILYENDVHCSVDGYSKISAMKQELLESYKHVGIVSSGDFAQGGMLGSVSKGEYIVAIMNEVGYDAIAVGNHEFDYFIPQLDKLNQLSNTKFLSCNFAKIGEDTSHFSPYSIVRYGDIDVAYIGITSPHTINSSFPSQFKDENGNVIYTFNEDCLIELVQDNVDKVKQEGAEYVVALSHVGYKGQSEESDITDIIENVDGLDVVLDAHTHSVIEKMVVKDKSGDDVILSSTGEKFEHIGKLTIDNGKINTELVKTQEYAKTNPQVDAFINEINESYTELGNRKIAQSSVDLITHDENNNRIIRNSQTNLGNLCADALRTMMSTDVSYVNGGGIRAPIKAGDVKFNDIFAVFPFNNQVVTARVSGQTLKDMLEMAVMSYPNEDGSFPHVSGIKFSINKAIPTSVKTDKDGFFVEVDGEYRVYDIKILDKQTGGYLPIQLDGYYTLAGFNYFLLEYGSGMSMFKDAQILDAEGTLDVEVLENYIVNVLGGIIDERYATVETRLTFTDGFVS